MDQSLRAILAHFRAVRRGIVVVVALSTIAAMSEAAALVLTVALTDSLADDRGGAASPIGPFELELSQAALVACAVGAILASAAITLLANNVRSRITVSWNRSARRRLVSSFLGADWSVQLAERSGRLQAVAAFIEQSAQVLSNIITAGRGLTGVVVLLATSILVSPLAAVVILALGIALFACLRPLTRAVRARSRDHAVLSRRYNEDLAELSEFVGDIRVFGVEERFRLRADESIDQMRRAEAVLYRLSWAVTPVYQALALLLIVLVLALAAGSDAVALSSIGAVAILVLRSVAYGQQLQNSYHSVQAGAPNLELMEEAIHSFEAARPAFGNYEAASIARIRLSNVFFSYSDGKPALQDVSLDLCRGEVVGLIGPSGAGKTTLAQLVLRARRPQSGSVEADDRSIQEYSLACWARLVSHVPQQPRLLHGSVHDNIALFRDGIGRAEVERAARSAGIVETIEGLPDGFDSHVGATTRNLSGGQVQRLGIARALAAGPSVLILDEPTSALDQRSEALVRQAIDQLRGEMIILVIAHRQSTLSICDRIVVLGDGKVEADGPIAEAADRSTYFRQTLEDGEGGGLLNS